MRIVKTCQTFNLLVVFLVELISNNDVPDVPWELRMYRYLHEWQNSYLTGTHFKCM